jgi:hypothetical protein
VSEPHSTENSFTPADSPASPTPQQERPELAVAGAFAGGLLLALLLKKGRSGG